MAKAKKGSKPKASPKVKNDNSTIRNGLGDVLGYTDNANPYSEQISDSGTMFKNLRWYFVSNLRQLLSELYCEIGLIQTIVDVPVDDALRGGVILKSKQLDEDEILKLINSLDRDDDINTVGQAAKWNRLFGGAGVLIMTDQDPMQPLNIEAINKDTPLEFRAVDMWELFWDKQNTDGYDPSLQTENFEHYSYYAQQLHKSRVMRMKGLTAPSFLRPRLRGWGFSVVEKLVRSINQYIKATDLGFEVLDEFKLDVYKIKNLTTTLMSEVGASAVQKRVQMANWQKNYQNAIVMDSEDDFDHKQLSFAGLAEAMEGIRMQVASDMRMPITKLFGTSASKGFATDQNDMEVYNAMVEAEVRNKIKYDLLRVIEIKCQKLFGFIPDDLSIEFKPLRVLSAEQEENVKTQKFNRVLQAKQAGEITTFEFREACNKDALLSISLDNNQDQLNTDDPEIAALVAGEPDPLDSKDVEDPGANREDTRKPRAWEFDKDRKRDNSIGYDVAAYEVDGGDSWISEGRKPFFEDPKNVDKSLWERARERSQEAFGKIKWQFVVYIYRKLGGKVK
jgi:phage-related protein (TIGR01555 family)